MKLSWRCVTCGVVLTSWAASERHADNHDPYGKGGDLVSGRLEVVWNTRACECHPRDRLRDGEDPTRCYRCHGTIPV